MTLLLGCIADDFTGATDLANNLVRAGMRVVQSIGVPAGPVNSVPEAFAQAHTAHRGMRVDRAGYHGIGSAVRLSQAPARVDRLPPAYAQHTVEVLREAGFGDSQIAALQEQGILPRWPPPKP